LRWVLVGTVLLLVRVLVDTLCRVGSRDAFLLGDVLELDGSLFSR